MPAPQLASASITDRIQLLSQKDEVTRFEVKGIEHEISKLQKVDAGEAFMLSGMLFAALGEYENSKAQHEKSLLLPYDYVKLVNYGISMRRVSRLNEAKALFIRALERSPGSEDTFKMFVHTSTFLFDYDGLEEVVERVLKANPDLDLERMACMDTVASIMSHLEKLSVSLDEYKLFGEHVQQVLQEYNTRTNNMHEKISSFDGVQHMYVELLIRAVDARQLVAMNDRLADLVLSDDRIESWDKIVINFSGYHNGESSVAA